MYRGAIAAAALAVAGALLPAAVDAQITIDGSLRPNTAGPLTGPNFVISDGVGRQVGNNLFHSFGQFNVGAGESATFTGPGTIANVIGRVTGGQLSSINGLIDTRSAMPTASFFLLNPAGVMLGAGASLNVGGAFHVTTADYVCLGSPGCLNDPAAGKFFANPNAPSVLTVAAPAAFGFLGPPRGSVVVEGSALSVDPGQTMSFVGGTVQVTGAFLSAPGGRVQLVSVSSAGEVPLPGFDVGGISALGSITVTGSFIDVSGDASGTVSIRGGNLAVDSSVILASTGGADGAPVAIDLAAASALTVTNGSALLTTTADAGRSGDIHLAGGNIELSNGSAILSTAGTGSSGDIRLTGGNIQVSNGSAISSTSGTGRGGDIRLTGGNIGLSNGSAISSTRAGDGAGGDIAISGDTVRLSGASAVITSNGLEGPARSGSISVTATGAMVITEASSLASFADAGDAAPISVSAGSLTMDQTGAIQSVVTTGSAGDIVVTAPQLTLLSGAQIASTVNGPTRAADIHINSSGAALISGPGTGINIGSLADGAIAGDIVAHFGSLTLQDSATIQSGILNGTSGGNVSVVASGPVVITDRAGIASVSFLADAGTVNISAPQITLSHGFVSTSTLNTGRAGDVTISGGSLELANGGQIASASVGGATGSGGDVHVNVAALTIGGSSTEGSPLPDPFGQFFQDARSGIFTTAAGSGPGGNITIQAPQIHMRDGGVISAASTGDANAIAGNITINFGDKLSLETGASITTASTQADGGNIVITSSGSILFVSNSQITTSVESAVGAGGNITLGTVDHPIEFVVLDNGGIHANAFGGPGGNINLFANVLLSSTPILTAITASSALSTSGTISINAVATDVTSSLPELRADTREAAALLRASCAARLAEGKTSSLVVAGREGVPLEPGGLMPSALMEPRRVAELGSVRAFLANEWPGLRLAYLDAACGR